MKRLLLAFGLLLLGASTSDANFFGHGSVSVSFGVFYSSLSPYGEWIDVSGGMYAWRPVGVAAGWRPYTEGHWVWTDDGWYWESDEPWGWAAYHYGRWYYDDYYGWVWIPGYDWAPAWVEWRYGGDYIGWAPLGPYAAFSFNYGVYYTTRWVTPYSYWSFVDCRYIAAGDVHRYIYRSDNNTRFIGRTRLAGSVRYDGNRIVSRGPDRTYVEARGGGRLEPARISDVSDPRRTGVTRDGGRERINAYRPTIERPTGGEASTSRPDRVRDGSRPLSLDGRHLYDRPTDRGRAAVREPQPTQMPGRSTEGVERGRGVDRQAGGRQESPARPNVQKSRREQSFPEMSPRIDRPRREQYPGMEPRYQRPSERPSQPRQSYQRPEQRRESVAPRGGRVFREQRPAARAPQASRGRSEAPRGNGGKRGR